MQLHALSTKLQATLFLLTASCLILTIIAILILRVPHFAQSHFHVSKRDIYCWFHVSPVQRYARRSQDHTVVSTVLLYKRNVREFPIQDDCLSSIACLTRWYHDVIFVFCSKSSNDTSPSITLSTANTDWKINSTLHWITRIHLNKKRLDIRGEYTDVYSSRNHNTWNKCVQLRSSHQKVWNVHWYDLMEITHIQGNSRKQSRVTFKVARLMKIDYLLSVSTRTGSNQSWS